MRAIRIGLLVTAAAISAAGFSQKSGKDEKTVHNTCFKYTPASNMHKAVRQCLDSVITHEQSKEFFTYDIYGNNIEEIFYYWNGTWVAEMKYEYGYDANGNKVTAILYWNWNNKEWTKTTKYEYAYNSDKKQIMETSHYWNGTDWEREYKTEITYNTSGNLIFTYLYEWENTWKMVNKFEAIYDNDGNLIMGLDSEWDTKTAKWKDVYKKEYTFDSNKNQIKSVSCSWNGINWIEEEKDSSVYDANGNLSVYIYYKWEEMDWIIEKDEYVYDADRNQIASTSYNWNGTKWIEKQRYMYEYDVGKNLVMYRYYSWNFEQGNWIESFKYESSYDLSYSKTDLMLPNSYNDMNNKRLVEIGYWWINTGWVAGEVVNYYWSGYDAGISDAETSREASLRVYPNPTTWKITVESDKVHKVESIEIYDVVGNLLQSKIVNLQSTIEIDISHL